MFVGREKELEMLRKELKKDKKSAVLIYGKRRIGKTTLIEEALKGYKGIVINHVCVKSTYEGNLEMLYRSVAKALNLPQIQFAQLSEMFEYLGNQKKNIVLILDEYPYLKESKKKNEVDSYMQNIIDRMPSNIKLVLCGSYISIMKELLEESNPLFGRFSLIMDIKEFDYYEASMFYKDADIKTKIERYAVFGGSPYILSNLDVDASLKQNIEENLLEETSVFRSHIENVLLQEVRKSFDVRILERIGNGKKKYSDITSALNIMDNGYLDKQLKELLSMEVIQKEFPINKPNDKKKQFYSIKDNMMRFYFTYIFANASTINKVGASSFYNNNIETTIKTFISLRFEEIVRQYFSRLAKEGKNSLILDIGSYWYDNPGEHDSGQFDCVVKTKNGYDFYECKYYEKPMKIKECEEEANQIKSIPNLDHNKIGFVCSSGFESMNKDYSFITGEELFKQ